MYQIKKEEVETLLNKLGRIKKETAEAVKILDDMIVLCGGKMDHHEEYNPDEYLKKWTNRAGLRNSSQSDVKEKKEE